MQLQLKIRHVHLDQRPEDDDVGLRLVNMVRTAMAKGNAPPVAVVVRGSQIEVVGLEPVIRARLSVPWFLASMSRSRSSETRPDAVGLMGVFQVRTNADAAKVSQAMVFLEWVDNRWWQWRGLVDAEGQIRRDTETFASAEEGDALPPRLGRWWSLGRRANLDVRVDKRVH